MSLTIHRWLARRMPFTQAVRLSCRSWTANQYGLRAYSMATKKPPDRINYNTNLFDDNEEHKTYKVVTANDLDSNTEPPTKVRMLARDFIEDSLYNPHYGYFSRQATIFSTPSVTFDFSRFRDSVELQNEVAKLYEDYGVNETGPGKQIWHTPTELFRPFYGQAIASCLVSEYLLKYFPYEDFHIYEIGAGNGTLAEDILNSIQEYHPEVYDRCHYTIIEISERLAKQQRERLCEKHPCVKVFNKSIFHWTHEEPAPCFFLAMEVVDNFAHDMIRYDLKTLEPYQGYVAIDESGDFSTHFTHVTDPLIQKYLNLRSQVGQCLPIPRLLRSSSVLRKLYANLPFAPNLSQPEYIPTRLLNLLQTLREHFPLHRLLLSDFSSLPDSVPGYNAPVVQTRYQNAMVPCSTFLVRQGYFDIFFPTNFEHLRDMYEFILSQPRVRRPTGPDSVADLPIPPRISPLTTSISPLALGAGFFSAHPPNRRSPLDGTPSASGLPVGQRKSNVFSHAEFLSTYADLENTRLKNGENPMVDFYQNVKFLF